MSVGRMVDTLVQQDSPYIYILSILVPQTDAHESLVELGLSLSVCLSVCLSSLSLASCALSLITPSLASLPHSHVSYLSLFPPSSPLPDSLVVCLPHPIHYCPITTSCPSFSLSLYHLALRPLYIGGYPHTETHKHTQTYTHTFDILSRGPLFCAGMETLGEYRVNIQSECTSPSAVSHGGPNGLCAAILNPHTRSHKAIAPPGTSSPLLVLWTPKVPNT